MSWAAAIDSVGQVVKKVLDRFWGTQTAEEASIERQAERLVNEIKEDLLEGRTRDAGRKYVELRKLRDRAAAEKTNRR